ncbi:THO complex 3 G protein beta subunit [Haematococcus lacustris]
MGQAPQEEYGRLAGYAIRELVGHKKRVNVLAWSCNGRKLASGSADQSIRIWAVEQHNQVSRPERSEVELKGHSSSVSCLAWRPGTQHDVLASTTAGDKADKTIRIWDVRSGKCSHMLSTSCGNTYLAWSPDGNSFATKNENDVLTLYDFRKMRAAKHPYKCVGQVEEILWGPSAGHMLLATDKGAVDVLSLASMEVLLSLKGHGGAVYCLAMSKDCKLLASGGGDGLIALWDLDTGLCVRSWAHMDHPVRIMSMSGDGSMLAYATEQNELEILSVRTGERLQEFKLRMAYCDCVAWNPVADVLAYSEEIIDPADRSGRGMIGAVYIYAPPKPTA